MIKDTYKDIKLECKCGHSYYYSFESYLSSVSDLQPKEKKTCQKHRIFYTYYCSDCNENFCEECKSVHANHKIIVVDDIYKYDKTPKDFTENLEKSKDFINSHFEQIKKTFIEKYQENLKQIESAIERCKARNNNLLSFLSILLNNYGHNYVTNKNLHNNSNFNLYEFSSSYEVNCILHYLDTFSIIKVEPTITKIDSIHSADCAEILSDGKIAIKKKHSNKITIYEPIQQKNILDIIIKLENSNDNDSLYDLYQLQNGILLVIVVNGN